MSEATVRCPKCGHDGIVITDLLNSDLRLIADSQAAEIERLQLYERAMQSMASQFVHPKMTAEELARLQLEPAKKSREEG